MLRAVVSLAFLLSASFHSPNAQHVSATGPADDPTRQTDADWIDDRWSKTDIGQFLHATIQTPGKSTPKALSIKVGTNNEATVCFDTDLLRYSAAWIGGFLKLPNVRYGLMAAPAPAGEIQFTTSPAPGVARDGSFSDPRPLKLGPLPRDWARYKGLYRHGQRVIISYSAGDSTVLESPWFEKADGLSVFTRTLEIRGATKPVVLRIVDLPGGQNFLLDGQPIGITAKDNSFTAVTVVGDGRATSSSPGTIDITVEPRAREVARVKIFIAKMESAPSSATPALSALTQLARASSIEPLSALTKGGPARWPQTLQTVGHIDKGNNPLAIDTITVPYENPWNALFFTSGHDFFSNGDAAVAAIHGDVWRVTGLDEKLKKITWKRFATGLYQPLGLKIIGDKVHVLERDQITILHDFNDDGEADYYENFNNDCISGGGSHSYATSLETDSAGNFYFTKCAENTPHGGTLLKVARDGSGIEVIATGFRNPNGLGIGPGDFITVADQQGDWVPETRLDHIRPGGFYGFMPMHKRPTPPTSYDPPLCWIPRAIDNSAGGQVWVPKDQWGPLAGQMLHLSYGRCTMMLVLRDSNSAQNSQGAILPLPARFASGVCRARFNPADRHLYLTGLRGWQTAAVRDGCFQRVRYREAMPLPTSYALHSNTVSITFSEPLDPELAEDLESYAAERWNYRWTSNYGSPDYSVQTPDKQGRDKVPVTAAKLQPDRKTLLLTIPDLRPVMQLALTYNLETASSTPLQNTLYLTINPR